MFRTVSKSVNRIDGYEKVTGKAVFGADLNFFGQLHAKTLYGNVPHAKIIQIDTRKAEALKGVISVITVKDIPGENIMFGRFPVLVSDEIR